MSRSGPGIAIHVGARTRGGRRRENVGGGRRGGHRAAGVERVVCERGRELPGTDALHDLGSLLRGVRRRERGCLRPS
jgi:hypothetical protein